MTECITPEGWVVTPTSTQAAGLTLPFRLGHDPTGYLLVVDGEAEWAAPSTVKQLRRLLLSHDVEASREQLDTLATQLSNSMLESITALQDDFRRTLFKGDVYALLRSLNERFEPEDIATMMALAPDLPPMLVKEWIVEGELHWLYSEPEAGKTWLALRLAKHVIDNNGRVIWVDEEVGPRTFAHRLNVIHADAGAVAERFAYINDLAYDGREDQKVWEGMLREMRPDMVVVDTATDALASADLDENRGDEVTRWVKGFAEPARSAGAAVLIIDHLTKDGGNKKQAVGSRAKRAKAKVQYHVSLVHSFRDPHKVGKIKVQCTKNSFGAPIPEERFFEIGGTPFQLRQLRGEELNDARTEVFRKIDRQKLLEELLRAHEGKELNQSQVLQLAGGNRKGTIEYLNEMCQSPVWPVASRPHGRSILYRYEPEVPTTEEGHE